MGRWAGVLPPRALLRVLGPASFVAMYFFCFTTLAAHGSGGVRVCLRTVSMQASLSLAARAEARGAGSNARAGVQQHLMPTFFSAGAEKFPPSACGDWCAAAPDRPERC